MKILDFVVDLRERNETVHLSFMILKKKNPEIEWVKEGKLFRHVLRTDRGHTGGRSTDRQKKPTDEGDGKHLHSENILSVNKQNHKRLKSQFLPVQGSGWRWPDWTQCCGTEVDSATIARFHRWRWWWDGLDRFPPGCRCHSTDPEKLQQRRGVSHLTWQERSFFIFILQKNGEG